MRSRLASKEAIATVAVALGDLVDRVVFVGGTVVALYPLEGDADVRPTNDVDCIVHITTTAEYYSFVDALRGRGFRPCTDEGAPLCRQIYANVRVDVMPTETTAIGPTNQWYTAAMQAAATHELGEVRVRAITPAYFVATKLEAFRSRGNGDYVASHDLEDVLTVLAGMPALRETISTAPSGIEVTLREELATLMTNESFIDAIPGHFEGHTIGQARARAITTWLRTLRG